jgi:hypothetical protein
VTKTEIVVDSMTIATGTETVVIAGLIIADEAGGQ